MSYINLADTHTHSIISFDGNDSCDELCKSAIEKNEQKLQTNAHHFLAEELGIQDIPLLLTSQYLKQQLQKPHILMITGT